MTEQLISQIIKPKTGIWKPWQPFGKMLEGVDLKTLSDEQLKALAQVKIDTRRREQSAPIMYYEPYESPTKKGFRPQEEFHRSQAKIRLFIGGNRSGKSEGGCVELIWAALGIHPFYDYPVPGEYWVVSLDFPTSRDVAEQKFFKLMPQGDISRWDKQERICYLKNGSKVGFRSCDQDINKFGGSAKDGIWFDEEPPGERGYQIYKECLMRTTDRRGRIWFTLTPVQGMSWTADEIYEPAILGNKTLFAVEVSTYDNPHLPKEEIETIEKQLDADEKDMRLFGKYVSFSGLVYKEFDRNVNIVKPFPIPEHWKKYRTIDHGINNPTACLWLAVNERDEYFVYDEYYETGKLVSENAAAIKSITGGDRIAWTTIDPSTDNRDPITNSSVRKEYYIHGIITKALRTDRMAGINAVKQCLRVDPATQRPKLFIFDTCYATLKEISRYRWKLYRGSQDKNVSEEPQKVLDHAMDALRYLIMSRPRYQLEEDMGMPEERNWYS